MTAWVASLRERFRRRRQTPGLRPETPDWRQTIRRRIVLAAGFLMVWTLAIEARLVYLQVYKRDFLVARAERQSQRVRTIPANRGDIVDRNGEVLATSVDRDSLWADPSEIQDKDKAAAIERLCEALADCTKEEKKEFLRRLDNGREFASLRREVTTDQAERVRALPVKGFGTDKVSRRYYPNQELAAHVLGFVGDENKGLRGIEADYDGQILGKPGQVVLHKDARSRSFKSLVRSATAGATFELTIDKTLQHIVERELHEAVTKEFRAEGGSVVVMNPKTGEILAMANEPTFNANQFARFPQASWRNRAVQNTYEPGSTFKIVTVSAAIEEKVMPLDTMIDTNPGIVWVGGRPIDEYDGHNYHVLSLSEVILKSSNVGAVKIGLQIGTTRLSRFVDRYGFGRRVSPDFRGEHPGIVWKAEQWTESALASVSMGYQVAVTPLQMAAAFSSIANGGEYVEPRVVRAVYRDGRRLAVQPRIVGRTISEETAAVLTTIMERVVEKGTATRAQVAGYTIAGKTGTAEQLIDGHYSKQLNNASFGGFLPSRNPELAIMVVVNAPTAGGKAGGMVAAPIFRRIAEAALRHRGIAPTINPPAPVLVARRDEPTAVPTAARMPQAPAATRPAFETPPGTMPDLTGLSLRDANRRVAHLGIDADLVGDGVVISQSVEPGTLITPGLRLRVALDRARPRPEVERLQP